MLDFDEGVFEGGLDVVVLCDLGEGVGVLGDAEHDCVGLVELDLDWQPLLDPLLSPEVEDLLGGSSALDGHRWLREDRPP